MTRSAYKFWNKKDLPKHVAYLKKDYPFDKFIEVSYKSIIDRKTKKQLANLKYKRQEIHVVPAFIWVFYNPHFPFGGWYIYIKTLKREFSINFRRDGQYNEDAILKAMILYPLSMLPMLENFEVWAEEFAIKYKTTAFGNRKKQGLAVCKAKTCNRQLIEIL